MLLLLPLLLLLLLLLVLFLVFHLSIFSHFLPVRFTYKLKLSWATHDPLYVPHCWYFFYFIWKYRSVCHFFPHGSLPIHSLSTSRLLSIRWNCTAHRIFNWFMILSKVIWFFLLFLPAAILPLASTYIYTHNTYSLHPIDDQRYTIEHVHFHLVSSAVHYSSKPYTDPDSNSKMLFVVLFLKRTVCVCAVLGLAIEVASSESADNASQHSTEWNCSKYFGIFLQLYVLTWKNYLYCCLFTLKIGRE